MKEISWAQIIQDYRDHITRHNLRSKTDKQLQEEGIDSCRTCKLPKGSPPIAFLTFFSVASRNLLAQSYTSRTVALFKQVLANLREEKELTGEIIEIINELLITLVYKVPPTLTERGAAIFISSLIQQTEGFERAPTSEELAALISQFTIIPKDEDLEELIGTPKFVKASNWSTHKTPEPPKQPIDSGTPDSGTSPWNTFNIPETTPGINAIGLNEEENPWKPPDTGKLISPPGTPNTESQTPRGDEVEDFLKNYPPPEEPLKNPFVGTSNLRFEPDPLRPLSERIPILPTFPTWESTDDTYYYNLLKNKGPAKRKVTFGQTIMTPPSNLLSGGQTRYQTRYQTRNNNSPEESPDDDDDDDNDNNIPPPNRQPNQPPPPPPPPPPRNMNDGNDGGNGGGQNNIMAQALTALAAALGNLQPAPAKAPREQNITQVPKFHGYGNEDPAEWAKRFDAAYL